MRPALIAQVQALVAAAHEFLKFMNKNRATMAHASLALHAP
jgi:hypothetical protein